MKELREIWLSSTPCLVDPEKRSVKVVGFDEEKWGKARTRLGQLADALQKVHRTLAADCFEPEGTTCSNVDENLFPGNSRVVMHVLSVVDKDDRLPSLIEPLSELREIFEADAAYDGGSGGNSSAVPPWHVEVAHKLREFWQTYMPDESHVPSFEQDFTRREERWNRRTATRSSLHPIVPNNPFARFACDVTQKLWRWPIEHVDWVFRKRT